MFNVLKCGTGSYRNAALTVAIIDMIFTAILLILFVLGSSVLVAFEFVGSKSNATRALDEITDDVLGINQGNIYTSRESKDAVEDVGLFLIFFFLSIMDFVISCIFLDGVKSKNVSKCQMWLDIRIIILVIFTIVIIFNFVNGASWQRYSPEAVLAVYRVIGFFIGFGYFKEIRDMEVCTNCNCLLRRPPVGMNPNEVDSSKRRFSVINLAFKRKEVGKSMVLEPPIVTITGPDESGRNTPNFTITTSQSSPSVPRLMPKFDKEMKL